MKKKNNLDEAQELKLLQIEHTAYQIAFWGLVAALVIETILSPGSFRVMAGEFVVFMAMCFYVIVACVKSGIYDRHLKPTTKTNLIGSLIAGVVVGAVICVSSYLNYHSISGSLAAFVFAFALSAVLTYAGLSVTGTLYKNRVKKLENEAEEDV